MSADNFVGVMQNTTTGKWHVWDGSASCEYHHPPPEPDAECPDWCRVFDTKEQAEQYAHERDDKDYYEYGVHVFPEDGQHVKGPPDHVTEAIERFEAERNKKQQ